MKRSLGGSAYINQALAPRGLSRGVRPARSGLRTPIHHGTQNWLRSYASSVVDVALPDARTWLIGLAVATACLVGSWALMLLLARRLPPGIVRDLAAFIPDCVTTVRRLRSDPRVPRRAKIAIVFAGLWVASPIDLIPEFLPVIGPLDDVVVVALALRYAARQVPCEVLLAAWPGERRLLERLLGPVRHGHG